MRVAESVLEHALVTALGEIGTDSEQRAQAAARVTATMERAQSRWIAGLPPAPLARLIVESSNGGDPAPPHLAILLERIDAMPIDEMCLALACALGADDAITEFENRYFGGIAPTLRRMGFDDTAIDEVQQLVRERLFVAPANDQPRILSLVNKGSLAALVRVTAVRLALNLRRSERRLVPCGDDLVRSFVESDGKSAFAALQESYCELVKTAFEDALTALDAKERAVLRLHLIHGLSIDEIGEIYHVHRATVARWLSKVRVHLQEGTQAALHARMGLSPEEFGSLVGAVCSRLDVSFARLLAD